MRLRLIIIHVGFALTGVVTTMLGPILPILSANWSLNDAQTGRLFTAQFVSSVTGSLIASRVLARWGTAVTVCVGMFFIAIGVACLATGAFSTGLVGIALFGIGLGFALPCTNLWVSELVQENRASALNLLNFSWTVGAVSAPVVIASLLKPIGFRGLMLLLAGCCTGIALIEAGSVRVRAMQSDTERLPGRLQPAAKMWFAVLTTVLLFLYVGVENGFSGWVPLFTTRMQHGSLSLVAWVQSGFWASILVGRLIAPLILRRTTTRTVVFNGLMLGAIGITLTVVSNGVLTLALGVILSGFGLSAVFPTMIAIFTDEYGTGGGGSIVLGVCGMGGALIPWLVGVVSFESTSLRLGLAVTLVSTLLALIVFWRIDSLSASKTLPST